MDRMILPGSDGQRIVLVALFVVLGMVAPMLVAAQTDFVGDDFEDGNANGWTLSGEASVGGYSVEGNHSIRVDNENSGSGTATWSNGPTFDTSTTVELNLTVLFVYQLTSSQISEIGFGDVYVDFNVPSQTNPGAAVTVTLKDDSAGTSDSMSAIGADTWYNLRLRAAGGTVYLKMWQHGNREPDTWNATISTDGASGAFYVDAQNLGDDYNQRSWLDSIQPYTEEGVTGEVSTRTNDPIENATVKAYQGGSLISETNTSPTGEYSLGLTPGTYNLTVVKDGYHNATATVTVEDDVYTNKSFTLIKKDQRLVINVKSFMHHATTQPYEIFYYERDNKSGELEKYDVTATANLSSNNTNVVTVDEDALEIIATGDETVNQKVELKANYTRDNETYETTTNVTVANVTLSNLKILPTMYRISATLSGEPNGRANPMLVVLIATLVGIVGVRGSTAFGGISLMTITVIVGWFGGFIGLGVTLVTVFMGMFLGLNLAANIDYAIHR